MRGVVEAGIVMVVVVVVEEEEEVKVKASSRSESEVGDTDGRKAETDGLLWKIFILRLAIGKSAQEFTMAAFLFTSQLITWAHIHIM